MEIILLLPILIFSVMVHEVSHGLVAGWFGDPTARLSGRLTLNPLPHIDWLGSVIFPAVCLFFKLPVFGWAKPVPVNPNYFSRYRTGVFFVSLAGPFSNLVLAIVFALLLGWVAGPTGLAHQGYEFLPSFLLQAVILNLVLAIFNLFPIPPLDGSKVLSSVLPRELAYQFDRLEPYGFFILMALIGLGIVGRVLNPLVYGALQLLVGRVG